MENERDTHEASSHPDQPTIAVSDTTHGQWKVLLEANRPLSLTWENGTARYDYVIVLHPPKDALVPSGSQYSAVEMTVKKNDKLLKYSLPRRVTTVTLYER